MSEYTKGPWFWDDAVPTEYNEEFYVDNAPWLTNREPVGGQIVTGQICVKNPANLALIAAAPELLEALKALRSEYVRLIASGDCGSWDGQEDSAVIQADAAIRSATHTAIGNSEKIGKVG